MCATLVLQGFTKLPSSAAHHTLPSETQNSELFKILLAFTGELGSWALLLLHYYTKYSLISIK